MGARPGDGPCFGRMSRPTGVCSRRIFTLATTCFLGRLRGRSKDSRPSSFATRFTQESSPNGGPLPRLITWHAIPPVDALAVRGMGA